MSSRPCRCSPLLTSPILWRWADIGRPETHFVTFIVGCEYGGPRESLTDGPMTSRRPLPLPSSTRAIIYQIWRLSEDDLFLFLHRGVSKLSFVKQYYSLLKYIGGKTAFVPAWMEAWDRNVNVILVDWQNLAFFGQVGFSNTLLLQVPLAWARSFRRFCCRPSVL